MNKSDVTMMSMYISEPTQTEVLYLKLWAVNND